jgi:predicted aldo/keto reductase-like oxidoreductase
MSESRDDRRGFLKKGAAGLGAMMVYPAVAGSQEGTEPAKPAEGKKERKPIMTRPFGKSGYEWPILSMGVGACENPEVVGEALDAGVVLLDTAWGYGNGANETMIADVVRDRPRDSYAIITKVPGSPEDRRTATFTPEAKAGPFIEKFEESLVRLKMDYVEVLCLHSVVNRASTLWEEYLNALTKMKSEGKCKMIGLSTHAGEPEVIRAAIESKVYDMVITAYNFRQPHVAEVKKAIAEAAKAGLGIVAMKTQAGIYWDRERQRQINMKAALKWVLQDENCHTAIPGFNTFDQLELDLEAVADLNMTADEKKDLELGSNLGLPGLYCPQCTDCMAQCPKGVDVPTMMRSYMYAYGYKNLGWAKDALDVASMKGNPCDDCSSCSIKCTMGFDVKEKVQDISRLRSLHRDFVA